MEDTTRFHVCKGCGRTYDPDEGGGTAYGVHPYHYGEGSKAYCLACWLGVGAEDRTDPDSPPGGP